MSGFAFNGVCHASAASAYQAFQSSFPLMSADTVSVLDSSALGGSTISYSITTQDLKAKTTSSQSGSLVLSSCNVISSYQTDLMSGLIYSALVAFFTAFFLRKAIRKFAQMAGGFANDF